MTDADVGFFGQRAVDEEDDRQDALAKQAPAPLALQDAPTALDRLLHDPTALASIPIATVTELHRIHRVEIEDRRRLEFYAAFQRAQDRLAKIDIPKLSKGSRDSRYAKTDQICRVLDPVLVDEGFSWSFSDEAVALEGHIRIVMRLRACGHVEPHGYTVPTWDGRGPRGNAVMTPLEASGAMRTYAERRLRMGVFGLHLVDDDTDGGMRPPGGDGPITEAQASDLHSMMEEKWPGRVPEVRARLTRVLKVETVEEIPARRFLEAVGMLERKG